MSGVGPVRDWSRYAHALDRRLDGATLTQIAAEMGITKQWASRMVMIAAQRLAFRVFKHTSPHLPRRIQRDDDLAAQEARHPL